MNIWAVIKEARALKEYCKKNKDKIKEALELGWKTRKANVTVFTEEQTVKTANGLRNILMIPKTERRRAKQQNE